MRGGGDTKAAKRKAKAKAKPVPKAQPVKAMAPRIKDAKLAKRLARTRGANTVSTRRVREVYACLCDSSNEVVRSRHQ